MDNKMVAIIGGDMRQVHLANMLADTVKRVRTFGINDEMLRFKVNACESLGEAIKDVDVVISSIPLSTDGIKVKAVFFDGEIYLEELFKCMNEKQIFFGGQLTKNVIELLNEYEIKYVDILENNEFSTLNAIATAEGALKEAIDLSDINIHGSKALVLGFGRCGKILADKLKGIGAKVAVEARKTDDLAYIEAYGYEAIHLNDLREKIGNYEFIFNTIPALMIDNAMLANIKKDSTIVDISSAPGGLDFAEAKRLGIKAILSLGIPGKVSPKTSAEIIWKVVKKEVEAL